MTEQRTFWGPSLPIPFLQAFRKLERAAGVTPQPLTGILVDERACGVSVVLRVGRREVACLWRSSWSACAGAVWEEVMG